jgi:hypothetical protein
MLPAIQASLFALHAMSTGLLPGGARSHSSMVKSAPTSTGRAGASSGISTRSALVLGLPLKRSDCASAANGAANSSSAIDQRAPPRLMAGKDCCTAHSLQHIGRGVAAQDATEGWQDARLDRSRSATLDRWYVCNQ